MATDAGSKFIEIKGKLVYCKKTDPGMYISGVKFFSTDNRLNSFVAGLIKESSLERIVCRSAAHCAIAPESRVSFLCVIDTLLTLYLLKHGAHEINPIMVYLLKVGPYVLFILKYALTCVATFCLFVFRAVIIRKFNVSTHSLLHLIAWIYVAVVAWELYLVYKFT